MYDWGYDGIVLTLSLSCHFDVCLYHSTKEKMIRYGMVIITEWVWYTLLRSHIGDNNADNGDDDYDDGGGGTGVSMTMTFQLILSFSR